MNNKVGERKRLWSYLRYYVSSRLEGLRKTITCMIGSTGFVVFVAALKSVPTFPHGLACSSRVNLTLPVILATSCRLLIFPVAVAKEGRKWRLYAKVLSDKGKSQT